MTPIPWSRFYLIRPIFSLITGSNGGKARCFDHGERGGNAGFGREMDGVWTGPSLVHWSVVAKNQPRSARSKRRASRPLSPLLHGSVLGRSPANTASTDFTLRNSVQPLLELLDTLLGQASQNGTAAHLVRAPIRSLLVRLGVE